MLDPGRGEPATDGNVLAGMPGMGGCLIHSNASGDIENIELALGCRLDSKFRGWIMRNMITVQHIVVPIALTGLHHG